MFSWSKRIIRKIRSSFLDTLAIVILAGLVYFCFNMLKILYATHLGFIILSILGFIISVIWSCYRIFTKRKK